MPTTIEFTFPWGRYHATAWDRNANEGSPDWPPAPWRVLRALYAASQWYCPHLDESLLSNLLFKLGDPPRYRVPAFTVAHTRHYYPGADHRLGVSSDVTKTFDNFVVTARGASLLVEWPRGLDREERAALAEIVGGVAYLGRADSLVEARLLPEDAARLVASDDASDWLEPEAVTGSVTNLRLLASNETFTIEQLVARPHRLRSQRLRRPPGTRWVRYPTPNPASVTHAAQSEPPTLENSPIAIRFALTGSPVSVHETVTLAETLRGACLSRFGGDESESEPALTGKSNDGSPLSTKHTHAHFLGLSTSGNPKLLDTLVVWVPSGLSTRALGAVARPHQLYSAALERPWLNRAAVDGEAAGNGRKKPQRLMAGVEAVGPIETVLPELCGPSRTWISVTPFGLTKHGRVDEDFIAANVAEELQRRGLPDRVDVRFVREGGWLTYRRNRPSRPSERPRRAFGLHLTFPEPVAGPIILGHLSHFGLGVFRPVETPES